MNMVNSYLIRVFVAAFSFGRISGTAFVLGCAALAISRVCQVLAFFLPLKIFILIYSREVPEYFNVFPEGMTYEEHIILLSLLVPVIYILFISLGIIYRWLLDLHLRRFGKNQLVVQGKLVQEKRIRGLHNHLAKAFSDMGLMIVTIFFAVLLDPVIAFLGAILVYGNFWLFNKIAFRAEDHQRITFLRLHRRQFIEYVSSANFLIIFGVLAIELVYYGMGVYTAIFLLLLCRMLFQAMQRFAVESVYLLKLLP